MRDEALPGHLALLTAVCLTAVSIAAGAAQPPRIYAVTDVRIVTAPGRVIDNGTVVMRDGLIEAVGADIDVPADATLIAGEEGWQVYPAFIDAASSVALSEESGNGGPGRRGRNDEPRPGSPHELESVRAEQAVVDRLLTSHTSIERHRKLGFAIAQVLPDKGVFRGAAAIMLLREAPASQLILADRSAQVVALEKSSFMARQYPSSSIGAVATVRQTLYDARRQQVWNERYAERPAGMPHPDYRASDAALVAVLRREQPVIFVAGAGLDPGRFGMLAREFDLSGMTVATGLAQRSDDLRAAGMPILLPLAMPDKPSLNDEDERLDASLDDLQAFLRAPGLPAALAAAEVEFAFVTLGMSSPRDLSGRLAEIVAAGLDEDRALAALTTTPARLLGIDRVTGTIETGKQANVMIVDGELFAEKPGIRHLFVDGYHEVFEEEATLGDPNAVEDPLGTWEITSEVMGRSSESTWTIRGSEDDYEGYSESSRAGRQVFKSVELVGNALTIVSETPRGDFDMTVIITGDELEGTTEMESSRGSATMNIRGRRIAGPEDQER